MPFILTGFRQDMGFRVFAFERRETTRSRMEFTVKADLGLIRRYDIRMQELPLLCRSLLERSDAASVNYVEPRRFVTSPRNEDARVRDRPGCSQVGSGSQEEAAAETERATLPAPRGVAKERAFSFR